MRPVYTLPWRQTIVEWPRVPCNKSLVAVQAHLPREIGNDRVFPRPNPLSLSFTETGRNDQCWSWAAFIGAVTAGLTLVGRARRLVVGGVGR